MECSRVQHWESHSDLPMMKCLDLMKVSNVALLMVKCLALYLEVQMESHLGLMKKLICILCVTDLVVPIKVNLWVPCSDIDLDKKLVLYFILLLVL